MNPTGATNTPTEEDLGWFLERLAEETPSIRHVLVLSGDGFKMAFTSGLDETTADQMSAVVAGIQSLGGGASELFGDGTGGARAIIEFGGGFLLSVPAGEGAHLAVVADEKSEVGLLAHRMDEAMEQIGRLLTARARNTQHGGQQ